MSIEQDSASSPQLPAEVREVVELEIQRMVSFGFSAPSKEIDEAGAILCSRLCSALAPFFAAPQPSADVGKVADLQRYIDTQQRPSWERIQQVLGGEERPFDENKSLCDEIVEAITERDALRETLKFYANHSNYLRSGWQGDQDHAAIDVDNGKLARQALATSITSSVPPP